MGRARKLQRPLATPTYEKVYGKIKNAKILSQKELITLSGMKKNARDVNERKIVRERRIVPTMNEVKEIVKQVKKKTDAEIERDEYSKAAISHIMEVCSLAKQVPETPHQIIELGKKYFLLCEQNTITPTSSGLARVLGMTRKELLEIVNGEKRVLHQEAYIDIWQMLEMYDEAMMKQGKVNAIVGIFNQKNNHNWVDKVEVVRSSSQDQTDEELKKKYIDYDDIIEVESADSEDK